MRWGFRHVRKQGETYNIERNQPRATPQQPLLMSESTSPTSLFWPIDVKYSGYCYGWTEPVLCVAGVAQVDSVRSLTPRLALISHLSKVTDANQLLNTIRGDTSFAKYCGSEPAIIGSCQFQKTARNNVVSFSLLSDKGETIPRAVS